MSAHGIFVTKFVLNTKREGAQQGEMEGDRVRASSLACWLLPTYRVTFGVQCDLRSHIIDLFNYWL